MTGTAPYAALLRKRFELARQHCGFDPAERHVTRGQPIAGDLVILARTLRGKCRQRSPPARCPLRHLRLLPPVANMTSSFPIMPLWVVLVSIMSNTFV